MINLFEFARWLRPDLNLATVLASRNNEPCNSMGSQGFWKELKDDELWNGNCLSRTPCASESMCAKSGKISKNPFAFPFTLATEFKWQTSAYFWKLTWISAQNFNVIKFSNMIFSFDSQNHMGLGPSKFCMKNKRNIFWKRFEFGL